MLSQQLLDRLFAIASLLLRHVDFVSATPKSWAHTCRDSSAEAADQISDFLECSLCQQSLFLYQVNKPLNLLFIKEFAFTLSQTRTWQVIRQKSVQ